MLEQKRNLFRKESLERLSSPERLDQLMQIVTPKSWLPLTALGSLVAIALIWSIYGRIPIGVEGRGVLVYSRKVVPLQSDSSGQLLKLNFKVGDVVKKGDVLGTIDQAKIQKQLQQERIKLAELQVQDKAVGSLQGQGTAQELKTIQQQRQNAQQRIQELQTLTPLLRTNNRESIQQQQLQLEQRNAELQALAPVLKQRSRDSLQKQRQSLQQRIREATAQIPLLKSRVEKRRPLLEQRIITDDIFLQAEQEYLKKLEEIAAFETQLKELEVKESDTEERYINTINEMARNRAELQKLEVEETNAEEAYLNNQNEISKLRAELKELDSKEANLAKQNLQDSTTRIKEIQEVQRNIAKLELDLQKNSKIISQHSGRILELAVAPGQVIGAETRIGSIDVENSNSNLVGITYFSVGDAKKIQPGMMLQITPQTIKRERFGGVLGTVTTVSAFPISQEAAISRVGNSEVVQSLVSQQQEGLMEVEAELQPDKATFSGYKWSSSKGPQLKISPGTTTIVRVKVEERAPITFVFPILRSYSGIY
jgi:HlyD family secretion protein